MLGSIKMINYLQKEMNENI